MSHIKITETHWEQMYAHVDKTAPIEACGFVAGSKNLSRQVYPITNSLHSATKFQMAEAELVSTIHRIQEKEWDLLAIYHSHPQGPAQPSPTDIQEATFLNSVQLIWGQHEETWQMRAFKFSLDCQVEEITIVLA